MSHLAKAASAPSLPEFRGYREQFGVVPEIVLAQAPLPRLVEADWLMSEVVRRQGSLTQVQKELVQLVVAAAYGCTYETALRRHTLRQLGLVDMQMTRIVFDYQEADLAPVDVALLDFALRMASHPTRVSRGRCRRPSQARLR